MNMTQGPQFPPPATPRLDPYQTERDDDKAREQAYCAGYTDCADGTSARRVDYVGTQWGHIYDHGYGVAQADKRDGLTVELDGHPDLFQPSRPRMPAGRHRKQPNRIRRMLRRINAPASTSRLEPTQGATLSAGPGTSPAGTGQPAPGGWS